MNLLAPVGTPFSHLIEEAGGFNSTPARVISGGPMMGFAQYDMSVTMGKASNCVLCLSKEDMPAVSAESHLHPLRTLRQCLPHAPDPPVT